MKTVVRSGTRGSVTKPYSFLRYLLLLLLWPLRELYLTYFVLYANHRGSEGTVKIGSNAIAEIRGWEMTESANTIDDTELADTAETHQGGTTSWTARVTCFWDETDTNGQVAMSIGASVTLNLYPEGATTGDKYYTGTATVIGVTRGAAINGMVEASYELKGNGAATLSTAA